jgi:hypothetical protein
MRAYISKTYQGRLKTIQTAAAKPDRYRPLSAVEQRVVDEGYVTKLHLIAIAESARKGNFAVSIRNTGTGALSWLEKGAATKPHSILEKTLKTDRVPAHLKAQVAASGLHGLAAHWNGEIPIGVFVTREAAARWREGDTPHTQVDEHGNVYVPINFLEQQDPNLLTLKDQPHWEKSVITGDYDTHDIFMMTGSGGPHSASSESAEEYFARDAINTAVSTIDPDHSGPEHRVVQHGPQVNISSLCHGHRRVA